MIGPGVTMEKTPDVFFAYMEQLVRLIWEHEGALPPAGYQAAMFRAEMLPKLLADPAVASQPFGGPLDLTEVLRRG